LSIASSSFLIAVTQREQVAQIFGKPIYVIKDVAILPLSSQVDACRAIASAVESLSTDDTSCTDTDTDVSDTESKKLNSNEHPEPETPVEQKSSYEPTTSPTNIARDVIANRGQYGRFAAQWFSKQGWGGAKSSTATQPATSEGHGESGRADSLPGATENGTAAKSSADTELDKDAEQVAATSSLTEAIPKILRRTKMLLSSGGYFFSYEFDLTRRLVLTNGKAQAPSVESLDPLVRHFELACDEEIEPLTVSSISGIGACWGHSWKVEKNPGSCPSYKVLSANGPSQSTSHSSKLQAQHV
jgi:hypothetical protein